MIQLFIFLVLTLIVYYIVKPTKSSQIWVNAIFIPLCGVVIYSLVAYVYFENFSNMNISSSYLTGGVTAKCLLPTIISGIVIFFLLKKKMKNCNVTKFPLILMIFIGISLIGTVVQSVLQNKNEKLIRELYSDTRSKSNNSYDDKVVDDQTFYSANKLDFNGLTFSYSDDWEIETEVLQENLSFLVSCSKKESSFDLFSIIWLRTTNLSTTTEMVESIIKETKNLMSKLNVILNLNDLYNSVFKGINAKTIDYNYTILGEKTFGRVISFIVNGNTVAIQKQSDSKEKLDTEFSLIEKSLNIK